MTEGIYTLKDDRKLSYAVYGPAGGKPVLYFHGTPSSRREVLLLQSFGVDVDRLLHQCNLRLIAPDRGALTTFHRTRSFASFAADSVELLRHFGITQCASLCWSGGGPYALAAASHFPQLITGVYILSGVTKPFSSDVLRQMGLNKFYFLAARFAPLLLQGMLGVLQTQNPRSLPARKLTGLPEVDYRLLQKALPQITMLMVKEATRKGTRAAVQEARLYLKPFDFSVNKIQQPIHYWWGTKDTAVVELHASEIERLAQHPVMHYREGEGHLSLYVNCFGEALQALSHEGQP